MINIQDEYRGLLSGILYGGTQKKDRTQIGTRSVFGRILRHNMATGFPLLTAKKYILTMQLRNYYGYYKVALILVTCSTMALAIGTMIMKDLVGQMVFWVLFMANSCGILMVLTSLKDYSSRLKKTQARGALWQAIGIPLIWTIWSCLLAIMVFKYI